MTKNSTLSDQPFSFPSKNVIFGVEIMKFLIPAQNFGIFASPTKGMDTFLFEMSMKWMFTFKKFRIVYWHGKTHSAMMDGWDGMGWMNGYNSRRYSKSTFGANNANSDLKIHELSITIYKKRYMFSNNVLLCNVLTLHLIWDTPQSSKDDGLALSYTYWTLPLINYHI